MLNLISQTKAPIHDSAYWISRISKLKENSLHKNISEFNYQDDTFEESVDKFYNIIGKTINKTNDGLDTKIEKL